MPTYSIKAITVGSFSLGESDKVLSLFSAERGPVRAVAKGARKPGARIAGRAEVLNINTLLLAKGRNLDIITQAEAIETFPLLRHDLIRLSCCLYYAELTQHFGAGLEAESESYFHFLTQALRLQSQKAREAQVLCLSFQLQLLEILGYKPELDCCVHCRQPLTDYSLALFHYDMGGILCQSCISKSHQVKEQSDGWGQEQKASWSTHITPLVWKRMILAGQGWAHEQAETSANLRASEAAGRIMQNYIDHRAGKHMRSLDLIGQL